MVYSALSSSSVTSQFTRRKKIHINSSADGALTDFQIKIDVEHESVMQSNLDDIRFSETNNDYINCWKEEDIYVSASIATGSDIGTPGGVPRVVVADNGDWVMVMRLTSAGAAPSGHEGQVWVSISTDDGETWNSPTKISSDSYDAINAQPVKYPNGDIDIFYMRYDNSTSTGYTPQMVSRSTDDGANWSTFASTGSPFDTVTTNTMWQFVTVGIDVYVSCQMCSSGNCDNALYKTIDNGSNWTKVGDITTQAAQGNYYEAGIAYLGNSTFVSVLRPPSSGTLQRRSINMGVDWSTDGYIKSDGRVLGSGVGTDIRLDQSRLFTEDINGNDLGYVYMQTSYYPGGYPRDIYAYISTDDCSSYSKDAIYTASDCHDSEIVFKSNTAAKYYPGQISGEGNITDDDITLTITDAKYWIKTDVPASGGKDIYMYYGNGSLSDGSDGEDTFIFFDDFEGTVVDNTKWDQRITNVTTSTDQAFRGTKSAKFTTTGDLMTTLTSSDDIIIEYWSYYPINVGSAIYNFLQGDSTHAIYCALGVSANNNIEYYDGSNWIDTGSDVSIASWKKWSFGNLDWTGHTFDITYNGALAKNDASARTNTSYTDKLRIFSSGYEQYIDCFIVRKYTANEPTTSIGTEQHQRRIPIFT